MIDMHILQILQMFYMDKVFLVVTKANTCFFSSSFLEDKL